jgi:hypothetical protein
VIRIFGRENPFKSLFTQVSDECGVRLQASTSAESVPIEASQIAHQQRAIGCPVRPIDLGHLQASSSLQLIRERTMTPRLSDQQKTWVGRIRLLVVACLPGAKPAIGLRSLGDDFTPVRELPVLPEVLPDVCHLEVVGEFPSVTRVLVLHSQNQSSIVLEEPASGPRGGVLS